MCILTQRRLYMYYSDFTFSHYVSPKVPNIYIWIIYMLLLHLLGNSDFFFFFTCKSATVLKSASCTNLKSMNSLFHWKYDRDKYVHQEVWAWKFNLIDIYFALHAIYKSRHDLFQNLIKLIKSLSLMKSLLAIYIFLSVIWQLRT